MKNKICPVCNGKKKVPSKGGFGVMIICPICKGRGYV